MRELKLEELPPAHFIKAAREISVWFKERGIRYWALDGIQIRTERPLTEGDLQRGARTQASITSDTDVNAPWLSLAHSICTDSGIEQGHITDRLNALRESLYVHLIAQPVPEPVGCTRSHPHEKMNEDCEQKAISAAADNLRARQASIAQPVPRKRTHIELTPAEIQSGFDRVRWAEALIRQLPANHDGRNSWLLNFGDPLGNIPSQPVPEPVGCTRSHPHEKMNEDCEKKAILAAANNLRARQASIVQPVPEPVGESQSSALFEQWDCKLLSAMQTEFEKRRKYVGTVGDRVGLPNDDTQVGVEFAIDWIKKESSLYTSPIPPALLPQIVETLEKVRFYPAGDIGSGFDVVADDAKRLVGLIDAAIAALKQIGGA